MFIGSAILFGLWVHPVMLGWMAAAAAPLVIHLLSRRRYRQVPWAAMQYLMAAVQKNSRRIRIENWLLLAVRTALIAAVVLALAQPMLERAGLASRIGQPTHKILVLDASYSMGYKPTDRTRFARAKLLAEQIVNESTQGDGFSLVLLSDPPQTIVGTPSFAAAEFLQEIAAVKLTQGGGDLPQTLAAVEHVLQAARREYPRLAQEQVFFLTDLGRTSWAPDLSAAALTDFRERSRRLGDETTLTVIDLGQATAENVAIEQLAVVEPVVTLGQEATLSGELRNFGRQTVLDQTAELIIDGQRAAERTIDLPAGGRTTVNFPLQFEAPGEHVVELRLTPDLLDIDNHRYLALTVKNQLRVLCVDGRPMGGEFKSATDYLRMAIAPSIDRQYRARVKPEVIPDNGLLDADLTQYDAIFLCDVAQFSEREARVLRTYLDFGGGLVFFLGEQVRADNYNRLLVTADASRRVLPARLLRPVEESHYSLDPLGYRHPLIAVFRDSEQAGLLTSPVHKYFQLQVPEGSPAAVALAVDNGDPFIVDETIGRGRSTVVATSADASWTAMPMWPSYVPIVQELLMLAIRGRLAEHNVLVGRAIGAILPASLVDAVNVRLPAGETKRATIAADATEHSWTFGDTTVSGIYRTEVVVPRAKQSEEQTFAVNVDTVESNLEQIDATELARETWPNVRYLHRTDWRDVDATNTDEIVVRSHLHQWLLIAAIVLLLTESLLNWFTGRHAR